MLFVVLGHPALGLPATPVYFLEGTLVMIRDHDQRNIREGREGAAEAW